MRPKRYVRLQRETYKQKKNKVYLWSELKATGKLSVLKGQHSY